MIGWRLHLRASRLIGRQDFAAAGAIYERMLGSDPGDALASAMLALCYEHQGRYNEALRLAEEGVRSRPRSLVALQTAGRLAVAIQDHDKAAQYLKCALALPEVTAEIPKESATPKAMLWILRIIIALPILRSRVRQDALDELELGAQAMKLHEWKRWALDYLAWHGGREPGNQGSVVH